MEIPLISNPLIDSLESQSPIRFIPHEMRLQDLVETYNLSDAAGLLFCGAVSILAFFILLLLVKNRERIYLHYALFLIFMLIYGMIHIESTSIFGEHSKSFLNSNKRLIEPVTILSFSFYIFFAIELMEIKLKNIKLYRLLNFFGYSNLIYAITYYLFFNYFFSFEHTVFLTARTIIFPTSLFFLVWIQLKIKSPIKMYFILGSVSYFIGSIVATTRYTINDLPFPAFYKLTAPIYFEMGIMIEVLCFALALGDRIYILHYEKQQANEKLIHQLSINEQMASSLNKQLEVEVKERTKEIVNTQFKLQEQEQKRLNAEYERELAESEMLARRLQIHPHFIFNCLNAIKYLIQSEQNEKASLYLVIFSKFIRMVLDSSEKHVIPIETEIEIIENYLKLEKNRFDNNFSYELHINDAESLKKTYVPPLILQPFIENAIWHGLLNSPKESKIVKIELSAVKDTIFIVIDDNGIGRKEANEHSIKKLYQSMGIALTKKRIKLYNSNFNNVLKFKIIDKIDNNGISLGTRIEMTINPKN